MWGLESHESGVTVEALGGDLGRLDLTLETVVDLAGAAIGAVLKLRPNHDAKHPSGRVHSLQTLVQAPEFPHVAELPR